MSATFKEYECYWSASLVIGGNTVRVSARRGNGRQYAAG